MRSGNTSTRDLSSGTTTYCNAVAARTREDVLDGLSVGQQSASVRLPVGVFEAVHRLAALRSVELGRRVAPEEVMEQAILAHLIHTGFVDQCL